jgi:hypothetical protein
LQRSFNEIVRGGGPAACRRHFPKGSRNMMKSIFALILVLVVAVSVLAYFRGWIEFGTQNEEGTTRASVTVHTDVFTQDKERLKKLATDKLHELQQELTSTEEDAKHLTGEAKAKAETKIQDLTNKTKKLESKVKTIEQASEDKLPSAQQEFEEAVQELEKGKK